METFPMVHGAYFEATLHCETERPGAQAFFNEMIRGSVDSPEKPKGVSFSMQRGGDDYAKLNLEVSDSVPDGLYVVFAFWKKADLPESASFLRMFESALTAYRKLQASASIRILERKIDGSFATRN
jgi:hypothetical protein